MLMDSAPIPEISHSFTPTSLQPYRWPAAPSRHTRSDLPGVAPVHALVDVSSAGAVNRRRITGRGVTAELVQMPSDRRSECHFHSASAHLLVVFEDARRDAGETTVEGLPSSTQRNLSRKLTFVPANHTYSEWHTARNALRVLFIYLDPNELNLESSSELVKPRLLFEDSALWDSALKLKRAVAYEEPDDTAYFEALGIVLLHELKRVHHRSAEPAPRAKGGLALYHQRMVTAFIEEHLSEPIPLATLAQLTQLSPFHFCRAFKQSFGAPPHRYHATRRVERAKAMLAKRSQSVTEIGLELGFCETSSFCSAFRKATGLSPTAYRRTMC